MARPERNNVDYFPHECRHGKKMFVIESKYGNDGYAVWFKLLECLGDSTYHYLDLRDATQSMYLASIMRVSEEKFMQILADLATLGAIDKDLYDTHKIVWSHKLIESVQDAYGRRNNKCITFEGLRQHLGINVLQKPSNGKPKGGRKPQSKEEDSKEEKSMEEIVDDLFSDRPLLVEAIDMWVKYKESRKEAYKTTMWLFSMEKQLQKFSEQEIIDSMYVAISSNHQGYFPKKSLNGSGDSKAYVPKYQSYEDLKS